MSKQSESSWNVSHPLPREGKPLTGKTCPWCKKPAVATFILAKNSLLDKRLTKIGSCSNKNCVNSNLYPDAHPNPPYTKKELCSRKRKRVAGRLMMNMNQEVNLLQVRVAFLVNERLKKLGHRDTLLACGNCNEWKMTFKHGEGGGISVECKKCKFKYSR